MVHLRAFLEYTKGSDHKSVQTLFYGERDPKNDSGSNQTKEAGPNQIHHLSCYSQRKQDETSKADQMYQKCKQLHPQFYFNNLGILHLKLRKYKMASFAFSKALKFLEVPQSVTVQVQGTNGAANQFQVIGEGFQ